MIKRVVIRTLKRTSRTSRRAKPKPVLSLWIAVRVKAGRERYAAYNVRRQGFKCFMPFIYEEGRPREQPLFPGYIFVEGPQWYYLQSTYGCLYPIMMGNEPAYMPRKEMKKLMAMADKEGVITIPKEKFVKDQKVVLKKGAWKGHAGVYIRASAKDRVRVLLQLLGGKHELEFNHSDITAAEPEADGLTRDVRTGSRAVASQSRGRAS